MNTDIKLNQLWGWSGTVSRKPFIIWAALLFGLKYNLDRVLLRWLFDRDWSVFSYFQQPFPGIQNLSPAQSPSEFLALLAISLPFLWMGVMLSIKRLRSAKLPLWFALLFVIPVLKWFLFVALALAPERGAAGERPRLAAAWLPNAVLSSAALAVGASVLLGAGAAVLATNVLGSYGWALFVGVPFSMGFFAALIHGAREPRRVEESILVALLSVVICGAVFLVLAFEGIICLIMAAPIALVLAFIGALAGHAVQVSRQPRVPAQMLCVAVLAIPLMLGSDAVSTGPAPSLKVVTAIEVNAPVETVWKHVIEFTELAPPKELLFKLGIAFPIRAEIRGTGPGAVRNCNFSTGPFVEPIEIWEAPRLLKFTVTSNPPPLQEWTPYHAIYPRHLKGFLVSEQGQFKLTPLPNGWTCLEGTTWYRHTMWPVFYWQLWSDYIIHKIHTRVLLHVKALAEAEQGRTGHE
ncbi:MAG TPA: hypothetical protein VG167_16470 [Verrucomicrobiae bacterium]|nr:hypothetical protein [Verrucomicrobiae bacterium]